MVDENISPLALAARLRQALDLSDKSQRDLADLFGISDAAVSKWLKSGKIGRDKLPVIANFLGVTLKWLASGDGPMRADFEAVAPDERELLDNYRGMDMERKETYRAVGEALNRRKDRIIIIEQPQIPVSNLHDDARRRA